MFTHSQILEAISYDPATGLFALRKDTSRRKAGAVINHYSVARRHEECAGTRVTRVHLLGRPFQAGRLAWFYMTGEWPSDEVDHHDNDGWNNRWSNLREASRSQNQANTRCYRTNRYGLKGVSIAVSKVTPFRATIQKDRRRIHLGYFETETLAHAAYVTAALQLHGEFARL